MPAHLRQKVFLKEFAVSTGDILLWSHHCRLSVANCEERKYLIDLQKHRSSSPSKKCYICCVLIHRINKTSFTKLFQECKTRLRTFVLVIECNPCKNYLSRILIKRIIRTTKGSFTIFETKGESGITVCENNFSRLALYLRLYFKTYSRWAVALGTVRTWRQRY